RPAAEPPSASRCRRQFLYTLRRVRNHAAKTKSKQPKAQPASAAEIRRASAAPAEEPGTSPSVSVMAPAGVGVGFCSVLAKLPVILPAGAAVGGGVWSRVGPFGAEASACDRRWWCGGGCQAADWRVRSRWKALTSSCAQGHP